MFCYCSPSRWVHSLIFPQNQLSLNVMIPLLTFLLFVPPHHYCPFYEDYFYIKLRHHWASLVAQRKPPACNGGDLGSFPEWGRSPGEGNGNPLQYSCLENPMDEKPGGLQSMLSHGLEFLTHFGDLDMTSLSLLDIIWYLLLTSVSLKNKSDLPPNPWGIILAIH